MLKISIVAVTLHLLSSTAFSSPNSPIEGLFPPFERMFFLTPAEGQSREANLLSALELFCTTHLTPQREGCQIDRQIQLYKEKLSILFNQQNSPVMISGETPRTPWDIKELLAANFAPLPSATGPGAGMDLATDIVYLRWEIDQSLKALQKVMVGQSRDLLKFTLVPSLRAYVMGASPFGEMLIAFDSIQCSIQIKDRLCDYLKERLGALAHSSIAPHQQSIADISRRLSIAVKSENGERMSRLGRILEFSRTLQNSAVKLSKNQLAKDLSDLAEDGQGAFADDAYQHLARMLIVFAEAELISSSVARLSPYAATASDPEIKRVQTTMFARFDDSLVTIKNAMALLGLQNEMEEN